MNRTRFSLGLALLLAGSVTLAQDGLRVLRDALDNAYRVNARKVVVHYSDRYESGAMTVSVLQSRDGSLLSTVIQPLSMQGFRTVDDGTQVRSYCPDTKRVWQAVSPRVGQPDTAYRMRTAQRNYAFRLVAGPTRVAGRDVDVVIATPVHPTLPRRIYTVDRQTRVLLRIEIEERGRRHLVMDTRSIEFLAHVDRSAFETIPTGIQPEMTTGIPVRTPPEQVVREFEFTPTIPRQLPLGFVVEGVDVMRKPSTSLVALRIGDGLVAATIYLWDARERVEVLNQPGAVERTFGHLRVRVLGDIGTATKEQLARAFAPRDGEFHLTGELVGLDAGFETYVGNRSSDDSRRRVMVWVQIGPEHGVTVRVGPFAPL